MDACPLPNAQFPPGTGPFGARGVLVSGIVQYTQHRVPGGLAAVTQRLDTQTAAFFDGSIFLASGVYNLSPVVAFVRVAANLQGTSVAEFVRARSRSSAKTSVERLYQRQLDSATPSEMAARLPRIFGRFFDPCQAESLTAEPGHMEVRFCGLPTIMLGFYAWSCAGFVPEALRLAGASDCRHAWDEPVCCGTRDGLDVADLSFNVRWNA